MQKHGNNWFMQKYIRDLYVVVFEFFTMLFVQWSASGWKRLINSFDKNAFDKLFTAHQRKMNVISNKLEREAKLERATRIDDMFDTMLAKEVASSNLATPQIMAMLHALGSSGQKFLEEADSKTVIPSNTAVTLLGSPDASDTSEGEQVLPSERAVRYLQQDLLNSHAVIRSLLLRHDEDVKHLVPRASRAHVEILVAKRLKQLLQEANMMCLWVEGPSAAPIPSQNTLTAVHVTAAAENSGLQVISHFCALELRQKWTAQERLSLLLQSMIAQVIRFVPTRFSGDRDLSPERLGSCFAPQASISELLAVMGDVLSVVSGDVLCVIDGVQALEQRFDKTHTEHLLHAFQTLCRSGRGSQSHKLLMTTDGYADVLARLASGGTVDKIMSDHDSSEVLDVGMVSLGAERDQK